MPGHAIRVLCRIWSDTVVYYLILVNLRCLRNLFPGLEQLVVEQSLSHEDSLIAVSSLGGYALSVACKRLELQNNSFSLMGSDWEIGCADSPGL